MESERPNQEKNPRTIQQRSNDAGGSHIVDNRQSGSRNYLSGAPLQRLEGEEEEDVLQGKMEDVSRRNETGLPDNLKAGVESLSGYSLDDVRVHYNSSKPATVQALAYTQGTDIHVAPGQEKHLPHEAWHVAQQMAGRVSPTTNINGMPVNDNAALEHEADVMGEKASAGSETIRQLKKKDSNSSNAIQCTRTVVLNPRSRAFYEIGFIMFGSSGHESEEVQRRRGDIARVNPAFGGIISAGHTMLHGRSRDTMFSYGFWTDNMKDPRLAEAFKNRMRDDAVETKGVAGEYRNDTHLSMIMAEEETRVVVKVSEDVFKEWQTYVSSYLDKVEGSRYTFLAGAPGAAGYYTEGLDNCVSFAVTRMDLFIRHYCAIIDSLLQSEKSEQVRASLEEDKVALQNMEMYLGAFVERMKKRIDDKKGKSGLQGTIMGLNTAYSSVESYPFEDTEGRYAESSTFDDSIYLDRIEYFARNDCHDWLNSEIAYKLVTHPLDMAVIRVKSLRSFNLSDNEYDQNLFRQYCDRYLYFFDLYMRLFETHGLEL